MISRVIISDTSCLIALERIQRLKILSDLFTSIVITKEVAAEFGRALPVWIIVEAVRDEEKKLELQQIVDIGEASAIALALETSNSLLIIDERKGRKLAQELNLKLAGTLQILLLAKTKGVTLSLAKVLAELENHDFRLAKSLKEEVLRKAGEL